MTITKGISFGFWNLDDDDFHGGDFTIICADAHDKYFSFVISLLKNIAYKQQVPTSFFSAQISSEEILSRLVAQKASMSYTEVRQQNLDDVKTAIVRAAKKHISEAPLYIDNTRELEIGDLCVAIKNHKSKHKSEIVFVDCLNFMTINKAPVETEEQLAHICSTLKNLAVSQNISIVAMAQIPKSKEHDSVDDMEQLAISDLGIFTEAKQYADKMYYIRCEYEETGTSCKTKNVELHTLKSPDKNKRVSYICYAKEHTSVEHTRKTVPAKHTTPQINPNYTKEDYLKTIKNYLDAKKRLQRYDEYIINLITEVDKDKLWFDGWSVPEVEIESVSSLNAEVMQHPELANLTVRDNLIRVKYFCDDKTFKLNFDADTVFDGLLTHKEFEKQVPADLRTAHKEVWGDENPADCFPLVFGMVAPDLLKEHNAEKEK